MKKWNCTTAMSVPVAAALCIGMHSTALGQFGQPRAADRPVVQTAVDHEPSVFQSARDASDEADRLSPRMIDGMPLGAGDFLCQYDNGTSTNALGLTNGGVIAWAHRFDSSCSNVIGGIATTYGFADSTTAGVSPGDPVGYAIMTDTGNGPGQIIWEGEGQVDAASINEDVFQTLPVQPAQSVSGTFFLVVWVQHPAGSFPAPMDEESASGLIDDVWLLYEVGASFGDFDPENPQEALTMASIGFPTAWMLRGTGELGPPIGACCFDEVACPWDLTGSGTVGVPDLLALIGCWGTVTDPDCEQADFTNSGSVGVPDLLQMINNWGACPESGGVDCEDLLIEDCDAAGGNFAGIGTTCASGVCDGLGACCFDDGSCDDQISEDDCSAQAGTFQGAGTTCDTVNCAAAGQECDLPASIQIDGPSITIDTSNSIENAPSCNGVSGDTPAAWYAVEGNGTVLTAATCGSALDDVNVSVFCATCANLQCVAASSGEDLDCPNPFQSNVSWCSEPGELYYVAVFAGPGSANPEGVVSLTVTSGNACSDFPDCDPPSNCCEAHGGLGCDDPECEAIVCSNDPFCCDVSWDEICAGQANSVCAVCDPEPIPACEDATGPCCEAHPGVGCKDEGCCAVVCSFDPFCCDTEWDAICAGFANDFCSFCNGGGGDPEGCGDPAAGDCCSANATPYCDDEECCLLICGQDPFCCDTQWDGLCAGAAQDQCEVCDFECPDPEAGYQYDCEGSSTNALGLTDGGVIGWAHRFDAGAGDTIDNIATTYGFVDSGTGGVQDGDPVGYAVMTDSGNGPGSVIWQGQGAADGASVNTDVFQVLDVPGVSVSGTFYIVVWVQHAPGTFPAPMDESSASGLADEVWLIYTVGGTFGAFDPANPGASTTMAGIGFPTAWLLRGNQN